FPMAIQDRVSATLHPSDAKDLVARMDAVKELSVEISDSPFVGLGLGQSPAFMSALPVPPLVVNAHNVILHAAVEGGICGALALAMLPLGFIVLFKAGRRLRPRVEERLILNWTFASLMAIYVAAQLTPSLYEHTFYFLIGVLASQTIRPVNRVARRVSEGMAN